MRKIIDSLTFWILVILLFPLALNTVTSFIERESSEFYQKSVNGLVGIYWVVIVGSIIFLIRALLIRRSTYMAANPAPAGGMKISAFWIVTGALLAWIVIGIGLLFILAYFWRG